MRIHRYRPRGWSHKQGEGPPPSPRGRVPAKLGIAKSMPRKWRTKAGLPVYARRKKIVELVNRQIEQARRFRQVLRLGPERVGQESLLS